jgi:RHS repeat-associated protein
LKVQKVLSNNCIEDGSRPTGGGIWVQPSNPAGRQPFHSHTFIPNRFLYQGKEWQTALALNLYDFHARQYDPALGRWLAMDPQGQFASPYNGMGNNPVMGVDPDGEFVF